MLVNSTSPLHARDKISLFSAQSYFGQLCKLCFPLMLCALSGTLMTFLDRIVLAKFDTQAMNAATLAGNISFIFDLGSLSIAMVAEVFVGQYNGAKQWEKVGRPVWQMIWFSLLCTLIFIPIGLFGPKWFIPTEFAKDGYAYFKWIMIFGGTFPLVAALSAFFIGRGKVKLITTAMILGNLLNLVLAVSLVFGISDIIPPLGAKGAAIATGIAQMSIAIVLLGVFLKPHYQKKYGTHRWQFDHKLFVACICAGVPNAVGHMMATAAWATVLYMLTKRGLDHITVMTIGLSIWSLLSFITEGLQKSTTALAANAVGAGDHQQIPKILQSGLLLQFLLALCLALPLVIKPELLTSFFIPLQHESEIDVAHLTDLVQWSCCWLWLAYVFDGMAWVVDGILTATRDNKFIMFMNSLGTWLFCITPIYFFVVKMEGPPILTLQLVTLFCFILFASYYLRYASKKWQQSILLAAVV